MTPHLLCAACGHVFAGEAQEDSVTEDSVTCPECGHRGKPAGVMKMTGFPTLETFVRNYTKGKEREE